MPPSLLKNVVKLQPSNGMAWNMLGHCLERESQTQDAIASWRQALAIEPDNMQALWGLAKAIKPADLQEAARLMARYSDQAGVRMRWPLAPRTIGRSDPSISRSDRVVRQLRHQGGFAQETRPYRMPDGRPRQRRKRTSPRASVEAIGSRHRTSARPHRGGALKASGALP